MQSVSTTDLALVASRLTTVLGLKDPVGFQMCPKGGLPTFLIEAVTASEKECIELPLIWRVDGATPLRSEHAVVKRIKDVLQGSKVLGTRDAIFVQANGLLGNAFLKVPRKAVHVLAEGLT